MQKLEDFTRLTPLVSTDGEKHAEFKRRRDEFAYLKVPKDGENPYLAEGWKISKKLKRQVRLAKAKSLDRQFEDRVWRLFYRMGYDDLNKGHEFKIWYKAADKSFREKQVDVFAKDAETVIVGECKCCDDYKPRALSKDISEFVGLRKQFSDAIRAHLRIEHSFGSELCHLSRHGATAKLSATRSNCLPIYRRGVRRYHRVRGQDRGRKLAPNDAREIVTVLPFRPFADNVRYS